MRHGQLKAGIAILFAIIALSLSGCCTRNSDGTESCYGSCSNEVKGYALFGNGTAPTAGKSIVFEWSDDQFVTNRNNGTTVDNPMGLVAIPFKFSATYNCGKFPQIQVRAFESNDGSLVWKSGDVVGRYDGTTDGSGTYISVPAASAQDLVIYFDGLGAQ